MRDESAWSVESWRDNVLQLASLLTTLQTSDHRGRNLDNDLGFEHWVQAVNRLRTDGRTIFLVGNGASAAMASHMAADLAKNGLVRTDVFSDLALITAVANDISYDQVFAVPLKTRMRPGDMLVAISSSGGSPNVLRAAEVARELGGMVATLTAMSPDNLLRQIGHLNFYVAAATYGAAESCHASVLHYWMDQVESALPREEERERSAV